ncbi:MAG: hypothetical protein M0R33_15410 [Methylomonas sp.]|uniref:hypothetical protein n=1 Tax=Methylomonas sp. TaxID=418 RepID=UPI0025D9E8CE|nr:hypothetical protein [Methylomonas sp.]MCK9607830.1 hypothetical protein [Methylomonas sp.]
MNFVLLNQLKAVFKARNSYKLKMEKPEACVTIGESLAKLHSANFRGILPGEYQIFRQCSHCDCGIQSREGAEKWCLHHKGDCMILSLLDVNPKDNTLIDMRKRLMEGRKWISRDLLEKFGFYEAEAISNPAGTWRNVVRRVLRHAKIPPQGFVVDKKNEVGEAVTTRETLGKAPTRPSERLAWHC